MVYYIKAKKRVKNFFKTKNITEREKNDFGKFKKIIKSIKKNTINNKKPIADIAVSAIGK